MLNIGCYLLLLSILFNNYKVINLINNRSLFKPNTFIKASRKESIKVGMLSLPIVSYSTQMLKGILDRVGGPTIEDLILKDIALVEGFYINIILEAYLL